MKALLLVGGFAAAALVCVVHAAPPGTETGTAKPTSDKDLVLRIEAKKLTLTAGEAPEITAKLTNNGSNAVTLVQPGDGSEVAWRSPIIGWSAVRVDKEGKVAHPATPPLCDGKRCGTLNGLKAEEIFALDPGQHKLLSNWIGSPNLPEPGTYDVVFYYTNDPSVQWRGAKHNA